MNTQDFKPFIKSWEEIYLRTPPRFGAKTEEGMKTIRVIVACEESQAVCKAFRDRGFEAFSCDIEPCSGGHPEWHFQEDIFTVLRREPTFDLMIAHPPCTFLSNAGACRLYPQAGKLDPVRYKKGLDAKRFFMQLLEWPIKHVAVENPVSSKVFEMPECDQEIQPYQFGHPYTKKNSTMAQEFTLFIPNKRSNTCGALYCVRNKSKRSV